MRGEFGFLMFVSKSSNALKFSILSNLYMIIRLEGGGCSGGRVLA